MAASDPTCRTTERSTSRRRGPCGRRIEWRHSIVAEFKDTQVLPGDVDRSFWRSGDGDLSRLLQQAVKWVLHDRMPVSVTGSGLVELFAWETEPGFAVHILNYTNPSFAKGWFREVYPLGPQVVKMELPEGVRVSKVMALRAGAELW